MGAISDGEAQKLRQSLGGNPNDRSSAKPTPANQKPANQPEKQEQKKFKTQRNNPNFQNRHNNQGQRNTTNSRPNGQGQPNRPTSQNNGSTNQGSNRPNNQGSQNRVNNQENRNNRDNKIVQRTKIEHKDNKTVLAVKRATKSPSTGTTKSSEPRKSKSKSPSTRTTKVVQTKGLAVKEHKAVQLVITKIAVEIKTVVSQTTTDATIISITITATSLTKKGKKRSSTAREKPPVPARKFRELPEVLEYTEGMNVADIAKKIYREPAEIIKKLFMMGVMVNQNQPLDKDTIELLATDYGIEPQEKFKSTSRISINSFEPEEQNKENLVFVRR